MRPSLGRELDLLSKSVILLGALDMFLQVRRNEEVLNYLKNKDPDYYNYITNPCTQQIYVCA